MGAPIKVYDHRFGSDVKTKVFVDFNHNDEIVNITQITYDLNTETKEWVERNRDSYNIIYEAIDDVIYCGSVKNRPHHIELECHYLDAPDYHYYRAIDCNGISDVMNLYTTFTIILENREDNKR